MAIEMPFWIIVALSVLSVVGSIGNAFIIGAVCLQKRLRVHGNAFVINLAVVDLIITAYIMPMGIATAWFRSTPFGKDVCDFNAFLMMCTCGVSTQTLMMIAVERYVTICKMHCYHRFFNAKTVAVFIVVCWVYAALWTAQGWTGWTRYLYGDDIFLCIFDGPYSISYDFCLAGFGMVLPMLVLTFCYGMIFRTVRKSRVALNAHRKATLKSPVNSDSTASNATTAEDKRIRREMRLVCTLFTIVIVFIVFWSLAAVVLPMSALWDGMPPILYTIAVWVALCNSSVNSIVYGAMNKNFRQGYRMFFARLFCVRSCRKCRRRMRRHSRGGSSSAEIHNASTSGSSKDTSQTTNGTEGGHSRRTSKKMTAKQRNLQEETFRHETANRREMSEEDGMSKDTAFVQYVHLSEGVAPDFYSSPILGATIITENGVIETRL